jgi:hypothetical protein
LKGGLMPKLFYSKFKSVCGHNIQSKGHKKRLS